MEGTYSTSRTVSPACIQTLDASFTVSGRSAKTRSSRIFSPWTVPCVTLSSAFDVESQLLRKNNGDAFGPDGGGDDDVSSDIEEEDTKLDCCEPRQDWAPNSLQSELEVLLATLDPPHPPAAPKPTISAPHSADVPDVSPGASKRRRLLRMKKAGHKARCAARDLLQEAAFGHYDTRPSVIRRYTDGTPKIQADIDVRNAKVSRTAFVGIRDHNAPKKTYTLQEMVGKGSKFGFQLVKWDGIHPILVVDRQKRTVCILAGQPEDDDWPSVHKTAAAALEACRSKCNFSQKQQKHRRGHFAALRCGVSFGGGQRKPTNLSNSPRNAAVLRFLNNLRAFKRLAGFASAVMAHRAPKLYAHYCDKLGELYRQDKELKRVFQSSVFAACTYNFGPRTVCYAHKDFANLPYGLCAITALGSFDPTLGGHLILWDCHLVIEFPPGSTILLPSAIISHSNVIVAAPSETRYSFTQYAAGGLFRWVAHDFKTKEAFYASLSADRRREEHAKGDARWAEGLSYIPVVQDDNPR